jgi:hypothetical protein
MSRRWLAPEFFTDEKMKKATVPERLLAAAIIANQDDDGRLRGDPAYLRAIAFLYDDYSLEEVKAMRDHLAQVNPNIIVYENDGDEYIQLKRYKRYQKPRYYHPSKFPAPSGWPFEEGENKIVTTQQPSSAEQVTRQRPRKRRAVTMGEGEGKGKNKNLNLDLNKGEGKGKGPKRHPPPSPNDLSTDIHKILDKLLESFRIEFGRVPAESPEKIIPREPTPRERAQIRDLAAELVRAGGCPLSYIREAFREAAGQTEKSKKSVSYVRAILLDWLGVARNRSP